MQLRKRQISWLMVLSLNSISYPVAADEKLISEKFRVGELFEPLITDPKEVQYSAGFHRINSSGRLGEFTAATVSYGEYFGSLRKLIADNQVWQLSIAGVLNAQFNMKADSKDHINADYSVGLSAIHRRGPISSRFRLFHQSTHLGDELILGGSASERVNFSLEGVDILASYVWEYFRIYAVAGCLLSAEPMEKTSLFGIPHIDMFGIADSPEREVYEKTSCSNRST